MGVRGCPAWALASAAAIVPRDKECWNPRKFGRHELFSVGVRMISKASGGGTATIQRIENSGSPITGYVSTVMRIEAAFEKAGILFITEDEIAGIGVRLAKKKRGR
jgi:hypothetical protein